MKKLDLTKLLEVAKKYKYMLLVILLGILLVSFPSGEKEKESGDFHRKIEFDMGGFQHEIEKALSSSLGVGRVKVILSLDSSAENVYAKEARQSSKKQESGVVSEATSDMKPQILSEGSGKQSPIVVKEIYPSFRGALVICDGADDISTRARVIDSVSALTGLTSDRISVIKMKN